MVGFAHEPVVVMARDIHLRKNSASCTISTGLKLAERCSVKSFLIIAAFVVMAIAPAFAALNVFTEKNRF